MVIAVLRSQLLSGDETVFQYVVDYTLRAQGCDCGNPLTEFSGQVLLDHSAARDYTVLASGSTAFS